MQFRRNVGDDAHIVPPGWGYIRALLNGEMLIYPVPFNVQGCRVRVRVDVGIDPYISVRPRTIQRTVLYRKGSGGW